MSWIWNECIQNLKRSWLHHTGVQLYSVVVLSGVFFLVSYCVLGLTHLQQILTDWGDSHRVVIYLQDGLSDSKVAQTVRKTKEITGSKSVRLLDKAEVLKVFKAQVANYAPEILEERDFGNPFPASIQVDFESINSNGSEWRGLMRELKAMEGVEDVSYGQGWLENYRGFVNAIKSGGWTLVAILILGSLVVVGNAVRASLSNRADEIEVLELLGATATRIRAPFVFDGFLLGFMGSTLGMALCFFVFRLQSNQAKSSIEVSRLFAQMPTSIYLWAAVILISGPILGALGAYWSARSINTGWAASEKWS